jgi:2,3-bisphosphoglycerate-independent phosphoglycerate mutase
MDEHLTFISRVSAANEKKIVLIVADGLGGLAHPDYGHRSELQYAHLPHLTRFVQDRKTATGLIYPVRRGVVPGSGAGHLGLFGYDPFYYHVGRGALEAAGLDTDEIGPGDVMGRMNFCTLDTAGKITDRRAGRIASGIKQVEALNSSVAIKGASVTVIPGKEHRAVFVIKARVGQVWSPKITDTDPQKVGAAPLQSKALTPGDAAAEQTALVVNAFTVQATNILRDFSPANGMVLRSFSTQPDLPDFNQVYSVRAAAISAYPLYRGIAKTVGMTVLKGAEDFKQEVALLKENFSGYDFFFLHYKDTDSRGEDGDFLGKVAALERFDLLFADLMEMPFDVLAITGDHATPSVMSGHSHHPVPIAISAPLVEGGGAAASFDESSCRAGSLGQMVGADLMPLLLAYSGKMGKFEGFA